jgi:heat shock protein HspQ
MSTESDADGTEDTEGIVAPNVSTEPRIHSVGGGLISGSPTRGTMGGFDNLRESIWMDQYGGERNLFDALGYIKEPRYEHYRARYERTDTAPALVDKLPKKAWDQPDIIDPNSGDSESEFEQVVEQFLAGEFTDENPIEVMERASRMERLGNFALIFLGLNDDAVDPEDNEAESAVGLLQNEVDSGSLESQDPSEAIQYLSPYDQGRADADAIDWLDDDPTDPRFGKPRTYQVDLGDNRPTARIHYTRVIHIVGNVFDNDYKSPSVLKQSINRIDDIEKILGGSAEGYWRAAYTGLVISPPEINGQYADFNDDGENLHSQINRYINNLSREIFTAAEIDTIDVTVEDPTGHLESQYKDLSTGHDIPQSILMGNETGERATQEDREMWHERVDEFRREYCEPSVLRPLLDRLIQLGVLPEPEGGPHSYRIKWPALDSQSKQEQANIVQTLSNAISSGTGGKPLQVMTVSEFRQEVLGWKPERGAMVKEDEVELEPATQEDLIVDEDAERVQEQFSRLNRKFSEEDKVRTSDDLRGFVVDVLTEGFDVEEASVEASEEEPKYVVVTESDSKPFAFYSEDELEAEDWDSGIENPQDELEEDEEESRENLLGRVERGLRIAFGRENQEGHFTWPESWRESEKPARLIAMDAWISMGPSGVSSCIREMRGEVADPGRFCADFADRLYMWDYWRGDSWAPGE